jgi:ParB-like chromosome segregation protein Spo0J
MKSIAKTELALLPVDKLVTLRRNPQYLTEKQMKSLKDSVARDGFVSPILVRPLRGGRYEVISGNHRFMAAKEIGLAQVPCVVSAMSKKSAQRLAVNLNTIHGDPNAELLAPFLADLSDDVLAEIHIEDDLMTELLDFDTQLADRLKDLEAPEALDRESPKHSNHVCMCPTCGRKHMRQAAKEA